MNIFSYVSLLAIFGCTVGYSHEKNPDLELSENMKLYLVFYEKASRSCAEEGRGPWNGMVEIKPEVVVYFCDDK